MKHTSPDESQNKSLLILQWCNSKSRIPNHGYLGYISKQIDMNVSMAHRHVQQSFYFNFFLFAILLQLLLRHFHNSFFMKPIIKAT